LYAPLFLFSSMLNILQSDVHEQPRGTAYPTMQELASRVGPGMMMDVGREAMRLMLAQQSNVPVKAADGTDIVMPIVRKGMGPLQTDFGNFWHAQFNTGDKWGDYHALIATRDMNIRTGRPNFQNKEGLLVRTDSGCITGQVFHDITCDCRQQLHQAMMEVTTRGEGVIVHIPGQDGRGMGLDFKLATLHIQQRLGADTVQAACIVHFMHQVHQSIQELSRMAEFDQVQDVARRVIDIEEEAETLWDEGKTQDAMDVLNNVQADIACIVQDARRTLNISDIDQRTYEGVIGILKTLGINNDTKIDMATNNPHKMDVFTRNGYQIDNTPVIAQNSHEIAPHLAAKARHLGHLIPATVTGISPALDGDIGV